MEHQVSTVHDLFVGDEVPVVGLPVPLNLIDIHVLCGEVQRFHGEGLSFPHLDRNFGQLRCTEHQFAADRVHRVEAHGGEHVPCGHLSAVVVPDKSVRFVLVEVGGDLPHQPLCLFGTVEPVVDVGHMVAGLVAVGILAYEAGHIGEVAGRFLRGVEEIVKHLTGLFFSSHQLDQSGDILHHMPGILEGVPLSVVAADA